MKNLIASILIGLFASGALAQTKDAPFPKNASSMHFKDGVWTAPTPQSALDAIRAGEEKNVEYATAVLRQIFDSRSPAELDAFAEELGRLFVEGTYIQSADASVALAIASNKVDAGIPYTKSRDIFMRIYESARGTDASLARSALSGVFSSNGEDYVRDLFHKSPKPENACTPGHIPLGTPTEDLANWCPYRHDPWCDAGVELASNSMMDEPLVPPLATDPTPEDIYPYCYGWEVEDGRVAIIFY